MSAAKKPVSRSPGPFFSRKKKIDRCHRLDAAIVDHFSAASGRTDRNTAMGGQLVEDLKQRVVETDLAGAAQRTGGEFNGVKLKLQIPGKDFCVDSNGHLESDIHINPYVFAPFFDYVANCEGRDLLSEWVSFRELNAGIEFSYPFF